MRCKEEMEFDRAVETGSFISARVHADTIATLDKYEGLFRSACMCVYGYIYIVQLLS